MEREELLRDTREKASKKAEEAMKLAIDNSVISPPHAKKAKLDVSLGLCMPLLRRQLCCWALYPCVMYMPHSTLRGFLSYSSLEAASQFTRPDSH